MPGDRGGSVGCDRRRACAGVADPEHSPLGEEVGLTLRQVRPLNGKSQAVGVVVERHMAPTCPLRPPLV
jgi:hypothetical protein